MRNILHQLYGETFKLGFRRLTVVFVVATGALLIANPGILLSSLQGDELIGPHNANAVTADTLYVAGQEVRLFGASGLAPDELCTDTDGTIYPCGREAIEFLQQILNSDQVICHATIATGPARWLGVCFLASAEIDFGALEEEPFVEPADLPHSISAAMVRSGWAVATGRGRQFYGPLQNQAQQERLGIWRGTVNPRLTRP